MLLIKRFSLILSFAVIILFLLGTAAWAFALMTDQAPKGQDDLRYRAETLLFTSIVLCTVLTAVFILLISRSRNIDRILDKLIRQNSMNPTSTRDGLLRLGKTGGKLNILYRQVDEISEKRGLKISALSNALELISGYLTVPVMICDISGKIIQVSRGWSEQPGSASNLIGGNVESFFNEINITDIILELEKTHLPLKREINGTIWSWSMIRSRDKNPAYLAVMSVPD